jgi:general secretion pathway protein G
LASRPARGRTDRPAFRSRRGRPSAFTLLELLVVIAVVAILSGIVLGFGRRAAESGRNARARAELAALSAALESYKLAYGDYPRTNLPARLLQSLLGQRGPGDQATSGMPLIELARFTASGTADPLASDATELLDPWGNPFRYAYKSQLPWTNPAYVLYSAGPDGADTAALRSGGFPDAAALGNPDNLWANQ